MKTIGYRDIQGGMIQCYFKQGQTRHERIKEALKELRHTGRIWVYLINGKKYRKLFYKNW